MGYDFGWYDVAGRFSWHYLLEATAAQVESVNNAVIEADNRNLFTKVMKTLFNPTNLSASINNQNYTVFKFYNNDGTVPPAYKTNVHLGSHTHYYGSNGATVDPDRKSVVSGKSVAVRGDLGGRRIIKKKKK